MSTEPEIQEENIEIPPEKKILSTIPSANSFHFPPSNNNPALRLLDACFDDVGYARYLLKSNLPTDRVIRTKVNWKESTSGVSILHCLAYSDLEKACKLLIQFNADVDITNHHKETPLHWCAKMNSMKSAKVLIGAKANLNAKDSSGSTPLHYAVQFNHIEIIVLLLDAGADVLKTDQEQLTPIELLSEGKSNLSKAMMIVFIRHYQKKGFSLPKKTLDKYGNQLTVPFAKEDILGNGNIINHEKLLQSLQEYFQENFINNNNGNGDGVVSPLKNRSGNNKNLVNDEGIERITVHHSPPPGAVSNYRPFTAKTSASSGDTAEHSPLRTALPSFTGPKPLAQPITIYDQFKPPERSALLQRRPSMRSMTDSLPSGLDSGTAFAIQNAAKLIGGKPQDAVSVNANNFSSPTKPRRRQSVTAGNQSTNNLTALAAVSGKRDDGAISMLSLLEDARKQSKSPSNRSASPDQRPKFIVRKLDNSIRSDSLQQLIQNMKDPISSLPLAATSTDQEMAAAINKRQTRNDRKMAQSMSIVPIPTVSIEEFIARTNNEESTANNSPTYRNNNSGVKPRRRASAPDIMIAGDMNEFLNNNNEGGTNPNTPPPGMIGDGGAGGGGGALVTNRSGAGADLLSPRTTPFKLKPAPTNPNIVSKEALLAAAMQQAATSNLVELAFPPADVVPFLPSPFTSFPEDSTSPDHLDVIVAVEHCCDCHLHNDQSLRHNVTKYVSMANAVLFSLIKSLANSKFAIRVYALRSKPLTPQRVGAFEVTISVRINLPELVTEYPVVMKPPTKENSNTDGFKENGYNPFNAGKNTLPNNNNMNIPFSKQSAAAAAAAAAQAAETPVIVMQQQHGHVKWVTHRLFSKLETKSWPNFKTLEQKAIHFIEVMMKDVLYGKKVLSTPSSTVPRPPSYVYNPSSELNLPSTTNNHTADELQYDIYHSYKYNPIAPLVLQQEIQEQYQEWIERMKIPPQIIRDPLDMEWPTEILYVDYASDPQLFAKYLAKHPPQSNENDRPKHPAGPYLEISLFQQYQQQKEIFERLVLEHFFVFDARFPQCEKLLMTLEPKKDTARSTETYEGGI